MKSVTRMLGYCLTSAKAFPEIGRVQIIVCTDRKSMAFSGATKIEALRKAVHHARATFAQNVVRAFS